MDCAVDYYIKKVNNDVIPEKRSLKSYVSHLEFHKIYQQIF